MVRKKGKIRNQRRILDASYNSVRTVSEIYDNKIIVSSGFRNKKGEEEIKTTTTRIINIYDVLEELKERLPLACKKHLLDYSSNSIEIGSSAGKFVISAISNSHLFGFLLPKDIKKYAESLDDDPQTLNYQIANSYYDFFIEPLVVNSLDSNISDINKVKDLEVEIKNFLNNKTLIEDISEFIELFHKYMEICEKNNIPSYWLREDAFGIRFNEELFKKIYSSIGKKKAILTNKIDEYELLFYWLVDKLNLDNETLTLIQTRINEFISTEMKKTDLEEFNYLYGKKIKFDKEKLHKDIEKAISGVQPSITNTYINGYLNKKVLETIKFLRSIDKFNEDVFRHYKLNCNMPMSKEDKLIMLSNYDMPMIFNYILQNFNYRMTKNNGLCLIKKEKDLGEREIKIGINLLKCRDKVNSFFKLPQINECLGYFSIPKINFTAINDCDNILKYSSKLVLKVKETEQDEIIKFIINSSKNFWKTITSTQIPMAYSLMYGNKESDKTLLYFESSESFNNDAKKLEDPNLGKYYLKELRYGGDVNCFSMINNVPISMDEEEDSLYFCGKAKCMIGVREKNAKQSIWVQVKNQKLLKDKQMFLNNLRNGKLDFDFVFLETKFYVKYTNSIPDTITSLNNQAIEDMNKLDSLKFFEKIKKLKNEKYWNKFCVRSQKLKKLYEEVDKELNYSSDDSNKNKYFDINTIFGLDFNNEERKEVLEKLKEEIAIQMRNNEIFGILEKYPLYIPENESVQVNGAFFVQLTNLYKTLANEKTPESIVIDDIIDKLLESYEQFEYNINADYSLERNVPIVAYQIIVYELCKLYGFNEFDLKETISLSSFIDFIKMIKRKTKVEEKGKH